MKGTHDGHRERVKQEFLKSGFNEKTPVHKILEMLLFYSIPRKDTNELAHTLLDTFGSLSAVIDAPVEELIKIPGITENTACLLKLIMPVARAYMEDRNTPDHVESAQAAARYLENKFLGRTVETVFLLCLSHRGKVKACPMLSEGDEISVAVSVRTVVEQVIKYHATGVMLAHNHPGGFSLPSNADVMLTTEIAGALKNIGVAFLDHIIFSDGDFVSMRSSKEYNHIFRL